MDPKKVESIVKMPLPKASQTAVREFLGAASFYRRWIDSYAAKVAPLQDLLKDSAKGKTTEMWDANPTRYSSAVHAIKEALTSYPVLRQPDFNQPFTIYSDASKVAIGAVLCQQIEGSMYAIHYASRSLIAAEKNYSVQELEALAIIFAVKKFRKYLLSSHFTVRCMTDHRTLECLSNAKDVAGRLARWAMIMSEYSYEVQYIKGKANTVADCLSRLIAIPEDKWEPLTIEDRDSDEDHR
eukprot:SAG31_NODE_10191_length_1172_cov_23.383970_1_plen_240_part_00